MTGPAGVTPALSTSQGPNAARSAALRWDHTLADSDLDPLVDQSRVPDLLHMLACFQHLYTCGIDQGDALLVALGASLTSLSSYYSSLCGPMSAAAAVTPASCRSLACSQRRDIGGDAVIALRPLNQEGPLCPHISGALHAEGYALDTYFCFGTWYFLVIGRRWTDIQTGIPLQQRNTTRRVGKKLIEGAWTLTNRAEPGPALEQAVQDYEAIYARSWKQPKPFVEFVPSLYRWTAERGWLRLGIVRLGDIPIAAQNWLVHQRKALIFKLAYDETHERQSAGSVLTAELMSHVADVDAAEESDHLTGDDAYKADWMTHRRETVGLVAFRLGSLPGLAAAARHSLGRLRPSSRRVRQAPPASNRALDAEA